MTTVSELIKHLNKLPPETTVEVVEGYSCGYDQCTRSVDLNLDSENGNADFVDLTCNKFVKDDDPRKNLKVLYLGDV